MLCPLRTPFKKTSGGNDCTRPFGMITRFPNPPLPIAKGKFQDEFTIKKVLSSKDGCSKSSALLAFVIHNSSGQTMMVKGFVQYNDEFSEDDIANLLYEVKVYKAMQELAQKVPHFAAYVQFYVYKDDDISPSFLKSLHGNKCDEKADKMKNKKAPHVHKLLVTTLATGVSLMDYMFGAKRVPRVNVTSLIFQILFCVYAMSMLGFQHNDLHYQNIHVDTAPLNKEAVYFLEGKEYRIPLPVHIRIFDFDQSTCLTCGENKALTRYYCKPYGICNQRNPRFDMYTALSYIKDSDSVLAYPEIDDMLTEIFGSDRIPEHFDYRMCNETKSGDCKAYPETQPASVMTPAEAIHTYFSNFLVTKTKKTARKSGRR